MKSNKNNKAIVSIIILSLLRQKFTQRCLESIFEHTTLPCEIIIVDMGKSKPIVGWLKNKYGTRENVKLIFNSENVGTTKGRNQGVKIADGRFILFLDNDMKVGPNWLEPLIDVAESNTSIAACGSLILSEKGRVLASPNSIRVYSQENGKTRIGLELFKTVEITDQKVNQQSKMIWYPTGCLLIKKDVFNMIGGLDENLFLCEEDKDLSLSIGKLGYEIMYVPESRVYHGGFNDMENTAEYKSHRLNLKRIITDKRYFENKWNCNVFIDVSWSYLRNLGLSDVEIEKKRRFDFTTTVIGDRKITDNQKL